MVFKAFYTLETIFWFVPRLLCWSTSPDESLPARWHDR